VGEKARPFGKAIVIILSAAALFVGGQRERASRPDRDRDPVSDACDVDSRVPVDVRHTRGRLP
jgi:hypothetical protein